jgi:uncharacterized protein (AIM24 family)
VEVGVAHRSTLAAEGNVRSDIAFSGLRTGLAGGEGFVLERFTSDTGGTLLLGGAGSFIEASLAGDGRVILQGMTISALAGALAKNTGRGDRNGASGPGGLFGGSSD